MGGGNIKQTSSYRLTNDTEKNTWNDKASSSHKHVTTDITDFGTHVYDATQSRSANTVLAAPNGSAGVASFRNLQIADVSGLQSALDGKAASNHGHQYLTCNGLSLDDNGAYIYGCENSGDIHFRYKKTSTSDYSYINLGAIIERIDNIQRSFENIYTSVVKRYQYYNDGSIQYVVFSDVYLPNSYAYDITGNNNGAFTFIAQKSDGTRVEGYFGGNVMRCNYGFHIFLSGADPIYWFNSLYPDIQSFAMGWNATYKG